MAQIRSILRFLNGPHPVYTTLREVAGCSLAATVFVVLFLMAFQPFGLANLDKSLKYWVIASYGLPDFLVVFAFCGAEALAVGRPEYAAKWKVWRQMVCICVMLLFIGAANYLHDVLMCGSPWIWRDFARMEFYTALVGVFPSAAGVVGAQFYLISSNRRAAEDLNLSVTASRAPEPGLVKITLYGASRAEIVETDSERLCYVKSCGNYVEVVTAEPGKSPEKRLLRAALKEIETQLAGRCAGVVRCHRSYLVNRSRVARAEGNALGLALSLDRGDMEVPVSRSYADVFRT